jgi:hypothetical protein
VKKTYQISRRRAAETFREWALTNPIPIQLTFPTANSESDRDALTADIAPQGELELLQFDLLLHAAWNLHRIRKREASLVKDDLDPILDPAVQKDADRRPARGVQF